MSKIGTVLKIKGKVAKVMTNQSDCIKINKKPGMYVGQRIHFNDDEIAKPAKILIRFLFASAGTIAIVLLALVTLLHYMPNNEIVVNNKPQNTPTPEPVATSDQETKGEKKSISENKLPTNVRELPKKIDQSNSKRKIEDEIPNVADKINQQNDMQVTQQVEIETTPLIKDKKQIQTPTNIVPKAKTSIPSDTEHGFANRSRQSIQSNDIPTPSYEPELLPIVEPTPNTPSEPEPNTEYLPKPSPAPETNSSSIEEIKPSPSPETKQNDTEEPKSSTEADSKENSIEDQKLNKSTESTQNHKEKLKTSDETIPELTVEPSPSTITEPGAAVVTE